MIRLDHKGEVVELVEALHFFMETEYQLAELHKIGMVIMRQLPV